MIADKNMGAFQLWVATVGVGSGCPCGTGLGGGIANQADSINRQTFRNLAAMLSGTHTAVGAHAEPSLDEDAFRR